MSGTARFKNDNFLSLCQMGSIGIRQKKSNVCYYHAFRCGFIIMLTPSELMLETESNKVFSVHHWNMFGL